VERFRGDDKTISHGELPHAEPMVLIRLPRSGVRANLIFGAKIPIDGLRGFRARPKRVL